MTPSIADVGVAAPGSVAGPGSVAAAELGKPLVTRGCETLCLADDPGIDPRRVLDGHGRPAGTVLELDPGGVAVVGHPVRLELEDDVGDDRDGEQPVEMGRVEPVGDVGEANRSAPLHPGQ